MALWDGVRSSPELELLFALIPHPHNCWSFVPLVLSTGLNKENKRREKGR